MFRFLAGLILIGLLAGVTEGCRSTKKIRKVITTPVVKKDTTHVTVAPVRDAHADSLLVIRQTLDKLNHNHIDFNTFNAKLKVHYEGGDGKDYEVNAFLRIRKDSMIWVSVNAALGIEAFRLLITPDSVKILDKLKKVVRLRSVSFLQDEVHLPVDFSTLQDLLIGNPIFLDTAHIIFYKDEVKGGVSLFSSGTIFRNFLTMAADGTQQHSKLDDTDPLRSRTGDITYGEYDYSSAVPFSTYRKVSVAEKSKTDIEINYKQYKFNEPLSFPFTIPKNYKRR
ncbi:DUF4292 domain-containing protein [Puia sp. P3]|uniref:DUF4292 domain-containing protein n=1 Tax=Puia sp. P3 TaxID=3423952 RepID=UPI003D66A247